MKHLSRLGLLLAVILAIVFVLPRVLHIPDSLQEFGFIPKNDDRSTQVWAARPLRYADPADCGTCHQEKHDTWAQNNHKSVSCENCHGPGVAHVETGASITVDTSRDNCGLCHGQVRSRPEGFPQIDLTEHGGSSACITCHNPHAPAISGTTTVTTAKAADKAATGIPAIPHSLEGRDDCLLCHDTGGIKPLPENHAGRNQETCQNCHRSEQT